MLVWSAFAAQAMFVIAWLVAGALEPGYSHVDQGVSYLAADDARHPWIVAAALVMMGASFAALALGLARVLHRGAATCAGLFLLIALGWVASAAFPLDCGAVDRGRCEDAWRAGELSWQHDAHLWVGLGLTVLLVLTPFALARALAPGTAAAATAAAGLCGVVLAAASTVAHLIPGTAHGLVQRADLAVVHLWVLIVGAGILYATRGPARTSDLIPMRPRDFLAHSWTGQGELLLRPLFIGRLFAQRGEARRSATWLSERMFRIDDQVDFGGGRVERRTMLCEFVSDDHVRLTADDLIDGADVWIEDDGWRFTEFRVAWPIGPLPLIVRCADRSRVEADGTFVNSFEIYPPGLRIPLARVTFRMRPTLPQAPAPAGKQAVGQT